MRVREPSSPNGGEAMRLGITPSSPNGGEAITLGSPNGVRGRARDRARGRGRVWVTPVPSDGGEAVPEIRRTVENPLRVMGSR